MAEVKLAAQSVGRTRKLYWKGALRQKIVGNSDYGWIFWQATHGDSLARICGLVETSPYILGVLIGCLPITVPIGEGKTHVGSGNIGSLAIKDDSLDNRALLLQSSFDPGVIGHQGNNDQKQGKQAKQPN
jgi:hypothetical protein